MFFSRFELTLPHSNSTFFNSWGGGQVCVYLVRRPLICLFCQTRAIDDECGAAILSTTNPTWHNLGSNTKHRRGGKPATNSLSTDFPRSKPRIFLLFSSLLTNSVMWLIMFWVILRTNKCMKFQNWCCGSKHCLEEMHSLRESALTQSKREEGSTVPRMRCAFGAVADWFPKIYVEFQWL
jgi:hypothetical protein